MKELSVEQKAQRYDEALKAAIVAHKDEDRHLKATLERIFPELKESEDEKIRKGLIEYFLAGKCENISSYHGISTNDILDWLKKQGKSIKIKKGKNYLCTKTHKYAGVEWREGIKYYSPEDYSLVNQGCTCYCPKYSKEEHNNFFKEVEYDGCLDERGEQNPTDKIEPKFHEGDIVKPKDGGHEPWQIMQVDILDKKYRFKDGYVIHFSQEDGYELVEQKPADEEMKELLHTEYEKGRADAIAEMQEWSEDNEDTIKFLISHFCVCHCSRSFQFTDNKLITHDELLEKIRNIRPQSPWKPNEEQMISLERASSSLVSTEDTVILRKLLNDLEKLRKE